jgi:hypothetical protein
MVFQKADFIRMQSAGASAHQSDDEIVGIDNGLGEGGNGGGVAGFGFDGRRNAPLRRRPPPWLRRRACVPVRSARRPSCHQLCHRLSGLAREQRQHFGFQSLVTTGLTRKMHQIDRPASRRARLRVDFLDFEGDTEGRHGGFPFLRTTVKKFASTSSRTGKHGALG